MNVWSSTDKPKVVRNESLAVNSTEESSNSSSANATTGLETEQECQCDAGFSGPMCADWNPDPYVRELYFVGPTHVVVLTHVVLLFS